MKKSIIRQRFPQVHEDILAPDRVWNNFTDIRRILREEQAVFALQSELDAAMSLDCDDSIDYRIVETVATNPLGLALYKNHPLFSEISGMIMQYHMQGTMLEVINPYRTDRSCPPSPGVTYQPPRMGLKQMRGLLMVTGIVGLLAAGFIVYERIRHIQGAEKVACPEMRKKTETDTKENRSEKRKKVQHIAF